MCHNFVKRGPCLSGASRPWRGCIRGRGRREARGDFYWQRLACWAPLQWNGETLLTVTPRVGWSGGRRPATATPTPANPTTAAARTRPTSSLPPGDPESIFAESIICGHPSDLLTTPCCGGYKEGPSQCRIWRAHSTTEQRVGRIPARPPPAARPTGTEPRPAALLGSHAPVPHVPRAGSKERSQRHGSS